MTASPRLSVLPDPSPIREWRGVTRERFEAEILPSGQPAVLRGLGADWPIVAAARRSDAALADHLKRFDTGDKVAAVVAPPETGGRFFYDPGMTGFNYRAGSAPIGPTLDYLLAQATEARPTTVALQTIPVRQRLPGLEAEIRTPLLPDEIGPNIWIGNRGIVAAHQDQQDNLAVVAAGRRRFTLFPPEQVANLYIGPFELAPSNAPVSLVDFDQPDLARHPRFADALAHAQQAELEPGDAIYIPYLWWHHVRSLAPLNALVNYWWSPQRPGHGHARNALIQAILSIRSLPEPQRSAWRGMFEHYVFGEADPAAHIPPHVQGLLGPMDEPRLAELRAMLAGMLQKG